LSLEGWILFLSVVILSASVSHATAQTSSPSPPSAPPSPPSAPPSPPSAPPSPPSAPSSPPPSTALSPNVKPQLDRELPDDDCFFNPDLQKCAPINGVCPDDFGMNEEEQCIPAYCPSGFTMLDDDESGTCFPDVIEKIELKIAEMLSGNQTSPNCNSTFKKQIGLDEQILEGDDAVVLAVFAPCRVASGDAILNLPSDELVDLNFVAVEISTDTVYNMVTLGTQKIQGTKTNQVNHTVDFRDNMLGTIHGEEQITISDINALALWNNSSKPVNLSNSSANLNLTLSQCSYCDAQEIDYTLIE
jgi:hypothetical protein